MPCDLKSDWIGLDWIKLVNKNENESNIRSFIYTMDTEENNQRQETRQLTIGIKGNVRHGDILCLYERKNQRPFIFLY